MAEFDFEDDSAHGYEIARAGPSKDWMQTSSKSIAKLQDVKKTFYRLGGGPREREVSCDCNYRTKSKSSYLHLETKPPEVNIESQRSASLNDLSVPKLLKEYSERQAQQKKPKPRPYSAIITSSKGPKSSNTSEDEEPSTKEPVRAFISVKGNPVNCQPRPPPGASPPTANTADPGTFKGIIFYDKKLLKETERATAEGFKKYSALGVSYLDIEEPCKAGSHAPRTSPELSTEGELATSIVSGEESLYSEDDVSVDRVTGKGEQQSELSLAPRPVVFEIPTGGVENLTDDDDDDGDDDDDDDGEGKSCSNTRLSWISQDCVTDSGEFLNKLNKQRKAQALEISQMFADMEQSKERVTSLRLESSAGDTFETPNAESDSVCDETASTASTDSSANYVQEVKQVSLVSRDNESRTLPDREIHLDPCWVEIPSVFPSRSTESNKTSRGRASSAKHAENARCSASRRVQSAGARRNKNEAILSSGCALQGKTISFLSPEDMSRGRVTQAPVRRCSEPQVQALDGPSLEVKGHEKSVSVGKGREGKTSASNDKKVIGKPPRPTSSKVKKKLSRSKQKMSRPEDQTAETDENTEEQDGAVPVKINVAVRPTLKKSISESCAALLADFFPQTNAANHETSDCENTRPQAVRKTVSFSLTEKDKTEENRENFRVSAVPEEKLSNNNKISSKESELKPMRSLLTKQSMEPKCDEETFPPPRYHYYTLPAGIIIQNGSEIREPNRDVCGSPTNLCSNNPSSSADSKGKHSMSQRAKILAKVKQAASNCECAKSECHCRSITRPTKAVTTEAKEIAKKLKEASENNKCKIDEETREQSSLPISQRQKLLKQRISRPSSAQIKRADNREPSPPSSVSSPVRTLGSRPRPRSASTGRKRSSSDGIKQKPRPSSAHIKRSTGKDAQRNQAGVKVLREGYLFKERPPPPLPPERMRKDKKNSSREDNTCEPGFEWGKGEDNLVASEECEEVYNRMKEKGVGISMETIKRGLMAPARRASDLSPGTTRQFGPSTGLLSRPETWQPLADEFARIKIWDNALKNR